MKVKGKLTHRGQSAEELLGMEFITDITVLIDGAYYKDREGLERVLQSYNHVKNGSHYEVKGSFREVDTLSMKLNHSSPATNKLTHQQDEHASSRIRSVSAVVMAYIEQKCTKELDRILGNSFTIETQPEMRTVHSNPSSTVQLTLRRRHVSEYPVRADFVRQRFITFYQRVASDLQVISVPLSPYDHRDLQRKFPHLLFKPSHNRCEVTGPFVHIAKLEEFLYQNVSSPSKSSGNRGPANTPRSRTPRPSPTHRKDPEDEQCPICMEPIAAAQKKTLGCKHSFCRHCLKQAFGYKPVCPTCGQVYGILTGTQPDGGKMRITESSTSLPGYEKYGTIIINYYIPSGIQKEEHPNPGQPYEGVSRTAYLPDSSEGRSILELLRRAFKQRLIFTVGRSTTSGRNNTVTWNDIHHKTSASGGPTHYGYPDPDYLCRVRDELKVKGIE